MLIKILDIIVPLSVAIIFLLLYTEKLPIKKTMITTIFFTGNIKNFSFL